MMDRNVHTWWILLSFMTVRYWLLFCSAVHFGLKKLLHWSCNNDHKFNQPLSLTGLSFDRLFLQSARLNFGKMVKSEEMMQWCVYNYCPVCRKLSNPKPLLQALALTNLKLSNIFNSSQILLQFLLEKLLQHSLSHSNHHKTHWDPRVTVRLYTRARSPSCCFLHFPNLHWLSCKVSKCDLKFKLSVTLSSKHLNTWAHNSEI